MAGEKPKVYIIPIPGRKAEIASLRKSIEEMGCEIVCSQKPIEDFEECVSKADVVVVLICPEAAKNALVAKIIELATKQGKRIIGVWASDAVEADVPDGLRRHGEGEVTLKGPKLRECILGEKPEWQNPDGTPQARKKTPRHHC